MKTLKDLRIVFLAATLGSGGAERQLYYTLKTLKVLGCNPSVITLIRGEHWESVIRELDIPVKWAGQSDSKFTRLNEIYGLLRQNKPDIIQSQHFHINLYGALVGRALNILDIGAIRSNGTAEVKVTGALLGKLSLYLPKYLAANSIAGKKYAEMAGVPTHRIRLIRNVVDTNVFKPAQKEPGGAITVMLVANLHSPEKRVDLFIRAIARIIENHTLPVLGIIAGDGPLRPQFEHLAGELGVYPGPIKFLGKVEHIEKIYHSADIVVLTSDREGTPNTLMEAMATGLPVVATNVGGVPDLIRNGQTGFLVELGDVDGIVEHITTLIERCDLRTSMGCQGRKYIQSHHSLDQMPEMLEEFYSSILCKHPELFNVAE